MNEDKSQETGQSANSTPPRLPRSYNFLITLSKQLGTVATKSSMMRDVRSFMNQEISISPTEKVFGNTIPKITVAQSSQQETSSQSPLDTPNTMSTNERQKDLQSIVSKSHETLMTANTMFPITLFPDTVTVDRTKVTITKRDFFWSSEVISFRIADILNVSVAVGPLSGSLTIASRVMSTVDHFKINHLWRHDAIKLKQMIQGYVIALHNNIDTSHLDTKQLVKTLTELGHDSN